MRAVLLLAFNFLLQQRWVVLLLVLYAVAMSWILAISDKPPSTEDVSFFLRQQSLYAPLFSLFLAVSAIHNERKSRRILAVMSKAVTRSQYLAGFVVGTLTMAAIYCLSIAVAGSWLADTASIRVAGLWTALLIAALSSALVATVAIFFSTFLTPIFATAATAVSIALPAVLAHAVGHGWQRLLPVYALLALISDGTASRNAVDWISVTVGAVETLMFWGLASWIFSGRDITTALE